ncbi:TetR/AcrR family transcriptional regulator [Rhodococcus koreensis]|uniref:TetR/AcrR family transcriptional regulator n=1 Tax=Rhodococcus koreensis TaxID=99653 RepID=UPI00366DEE57
MSATGMKMTAPSQTSPRSNCSATNRGVVETIRSPGSGTSSIIAESGGAIEYVDAGVRQRTARGKFGRMYTMETAAPADGSTKTWDRIVELAQQRLQVAGYSGLHYGDIASKLQISRPAVHHYFPVKLDLARAVINRYCEWTQTQLDAIADSPDDPKDRLQNYVSLYRGTIIDGDERLCPGVMLAAELMTLPVEIGGDVYRMHIDWLVEQFYNDLPADRACRAEGRAVASLQGAVLVGRVLGEPALLEAAAADIASSLR